MERERITHDETEDEEREDVYRTTSADTGGDDILSRRPGTADQTPGEGGMTPNHAAGVDEAVTEPRRAPVGARDDEEADEMPGGTAGYAGRGDTGSGREAPGGAQGYASEDLPNDAEELFEKD